MGQKRRVYSKEFKEQVVLLSETSGKLVTEIAQDLGILKTCSDPSIIHCQSAIRQQQ